ncbi:MAG: hypothetical protein H0A75_08975 [Candidatus Methanofishera endochildressiae]|uniref:Uncharacterized protein n=1 Tax=Candidatus Methanofishera endochildressiae TaxID=2738884 RepID=A0A7Z0SEE5_9GAMM|nr:hypothetical protein [Candidatus Methanofishera endochildressiae]
MNPRSTHRGEHDNHCGTDEPRSTALQGERAVRMPMKTGHHAQGEHDNHYVAGGTRVCLEESTIASTTPMNHDLRARGRHDSHYGAVGGGLRSGERWHLKPPWTRSRSRQAR